MATAAEHQDRAERHLRFLDQIGDEFPEWLTTVAFYAAVELVEKCPTAKGAREDLIGKRLRFIIQYVAAHT